MLFNGVDKKERLCFLGGLGNCYTHATVHSPISTFPSCPAVFCEALALIHPSGVGVPLHFTLLVRAPVPVHALS